MIVCFAHLREKQNLRANRVFKLPATSSGGYDSSKNPYYNAAQRGTDATQMQNTSEGIQDAGLVTQSTSGGNLANEVQDAKQGVDVDTRREVNSIGGPKEVVGLNSTESSKDDYAESWDSRDEAKGRLGAPMK
jgi:hypothetical protein